MNNEGQACDGSVKKSAFLTSRPFVLFSFEIEIYVCNHLRTRQGNECHYEAQWKEPLTCAWRLHLREWWNYRRKCLKGQDTEI
jgi:hypothetical protein